MLIAVFAAIAIGTFGFRQANGQSVAEPTLLLEQLDGRVTEACGLTLVLRRHPAEPHLVAQTVCPLFRSGFEEH